MDHKDDEILEAVFGDSLQEESKRANSYEMEYMRCMKALNSQKINYHTFAKLLNSQKQPALPVLPVLPVQKNQKVNG